MTAEKTALRFILKAQRYALAKSERLRIQAALQTQLGDWLEAQASSIVALYSPIQGEFNLLNLVSKQTLAHYIFCLPVVTEKNAALKFARFSADTELCRGAYGVLEPKQIDWLTPNIIVAPCIGFNAAQQRLGYGGGYYDRTLASLTNARLVGVAQASAACNFDANDLDVKMTKLFYA